MWYTADTDLGPTTDMIMPIVWFRIPVGYEDLEAIGGVDLSMLELILVPPQFHSD